MSKIKQYIRQKKEYEDALEFLILMYEDNKPPEFNIEYLQDILSTSTYKIPKKDHFDLVMEAIKQA